MSKSASASPVGWLRQLPNQLFNQLFNRLYVRIYLAILFSLVVAATLFALTWRMNADSRQIGPSLESFAVIAADVLPPPDASPEDQRAALMRWKGRMRADLALYSAEGDLIAAVGRPLPPLKSSQTSSGWLNGGPPVFAVKLPDHRWLVGQRAHAHRRKPPISLLTAWLIIAVAVGIGAYPIVRRLTRRLERLQSSVEALGAGQLSTRITMQGDDEVGRLAHSFNRSAARIEALIEAQKTLLANASHELRSPLARIRMAAELMEQQAPPTIREELNRNIVELDQLIDEILLASRLDATSDTSSSFEPLDLTALVAEECARIGSGIELEMAAQTIEIQGDARLLRRMIRNLLENARRYGNGTTIKVTLAAIANQLVFEVCDSGPGVPKAEREKIFVPFYRLPGARERDGGVGLGLSLVQQIARRHGGDVICLARQEAGSCFKVTLPA